MLWKVSEDSPYVFAGEDRNIGAGGQNRQARNRILDDFSLSTEFFSRCQNNPSSLDIHVERIPRLNPKSATKRAGKNDLTLG